MTMNDVTKTITDMALDIIRVSSLPIELSGALATDLYNEGYRKVDAEIATTTEVERLKAKLRTVRGRANAYKTNYERLKAEKDNLIKTYAECMKDVAKEIFDGLKTGLKDRIKSFQISTLEFEKGLCAAYARTLAEVEFMEKKYIGD